VAHHAGDAAVGTAVPAAHIHLGLHQPRQMVFGLEHRDPAHEIQAAAGVVVAQLDGEDAPADEGAVAGPAGAADPRVDPRVAVDQG